MYMSPLTEAVNRLANASINSDYWQERQMSANLYRDVRAAREATERLRQAREREEDARREARIQYDLRHDLHVTEDKCPLCGDRAYSLWSTEATDAERWTAAHLTLETAMALGIEL
jgi:hypothetical protein